MKLTLIALFLCLTVAAQDASKLTEKPAKPAEKIKDTLALTPEEIAVGQKVQRDLQDAANQLNDALKQSQTIRTEEQGNALFWKIKSFYGDVIASDKAYKSWLDNTQKAHNCAGCAIENNRFIRPAETPTKP